MKSTNKTIIKLSVVSVIVASVLLSALLITSCNHQKKLKVASLAGPTSVGIVQMMDRYKADYDYSCYGQVDALISSIASGSVDIALLPSNLAANLYNKTNGEVQVIDINTLGVLKFVSQDGEVNSLEHLAGKTLYSTGNGTIVQAVLELLLQNKNIDINNINIQYKSDATEVFTLLTQDDKAVGLVNEPQASTAVESNSNIKILMNIDDLWKGTFGKDHNFITGVTVAKKSLIESQKDKINTFLEGHKASIDFANNEPEETAELWQKLINENNKPTVKAIKNSFASFIDGQKMKNQLHDFYNIIGKKNAELLGDKIPDDNFYYINK